MNKIINKKIEIVNKVIEEVQETFNKPKKKSIEVSFKFPQEHKQHKAIAECSQSIFTTILEHEQSKEVKKNLSFFTCKSKFCPVCNQMKSKKWAKALYHRATELQQQEQRFIFLTLTIKNCNIEDLDETIKLMNKQWLIFWKQTLSKQFNGFIKILEITFPNGKEAHPHFHILLSTDKKYFYKSNKDYLTTEKISKIWGRLLKVDYLPIVDIRIIKPKKTKEGYISKEAIPAVIAEMTKYPMKDTDYKKLTPDTMVLLYNELYRKRLIATGGNLKISINKIEDNIGKEVEVEDLEEWKQIAYIVLQYVKGGYLPAGGNFYK